VLRRHRLTARVLPWLCLALAFGCGASSEDGEGVSNGPDPDASSDVSSADSVEDAGSDAAQTEGSVDDGGTEDASPSDAGASDATGVDSPPPEPLTYENVVLDVSGDPDCSEFDGAYHLYLPEQIHQNGSTIGGRVVGYRSPDLVHWSPLGQVFHNTNQSYGGAVTQGLWAPEVLAWGGKYYLFYVNVMSGGLDSQVGNKDIAVVESDDPADFDKGTQRKVLLDNGYAYIDPSPFQDPKSQGLYLLYKRRNAAGTGTSIVIRPMKDPFAFSGGETLLLDSKDVPGVGQLEHPMLHAAKNVYYLLFSFGEGDQPTYRINYATATTPLGPFTLRGTLFASDTNLSGNVQKKVIAPGASSIVEDGAGQTWIVYRQKKTAATTFADRGVCIDPVAFDPAKKEVNGTPTKGVVRPGPKF